MSPQRWIGAALALAVAAVLQMTIAYSLSIGPARPDILLTTLICAGLMLGMTASSAAGVWAGILIATMVGVNFGSFLVSRATVGLLTGYLAEQGLREEIAVPPLATLVATVLCEGIYYLMAPAHRGIWWAERVALEAVYNAVLSVPITLLLRRMGLKAKPRH
jgi:rod shape-determining protein MreD